MRIALLTFAALTLTATAFAAAPRAKVGVQSTQLGRVLVDARGRTLYVFDLDARGRSSCSGSCTAAWPPLLTTGTPVALAGVPANRLGTTKRGDGRRQVTFMGHPLYRFARDRRAGQVAGAGVAHWAALTAAGTRLRVQAAPIPTPPTTTTDPGDGYGGGYGP